MYRLKKCSSFDCHKMQQDSPALLNKKAWAYGVVFDLVTSRREFYFDIRDRVCDKSIIKMFM